MVARVIKPSQGEGSLTSSFLAMLPTHTGRMRPAAEGIVRENVLDLVAVSLAQQTEIMSPKISSAHSLALMSLRAVVEARLTDPNVDAAAVAAAAGISVRYANAVLAREGTSIMRLIRTRRLERCRRTLEDPLHAHRMVSDVAYSWEFSDMTHFARSFKAAYGVAPRDYRSLARDARLGSIRLAANALKDDGFLQP